MCIIVSQCWQAGFEEGVVVGSIDGFGLSLFGLIGRRALGGGCAGRFALR